MNDHDMNATGTSGCGDGKPCCGKGKWIWIVLILAIAGVMIAKYAERKPAPESLAAPTATSVAGQTAGSPAEASVQAKALPRLVDLGADKCMQCKMMAPILDDLRKTYAGKMDVEFVDVWKDPDAGTKYRINVIPTQIFFDAQGKELFRHEGFFGKDDILAKWRELGVELSAAE